jgi:response regulator of citrate/malate metabolism
MNIQTLIVEDDPMVSDINKRFLEKMDSFKLIGIAKNGEEALQYLARHPIDLLLLDVYMPVLSGMELLRKIRANEYKIDIILITAANSPDIIEEAMRLGTVDCILKPFDFIRFRSALSRYKNRYMMFRSNHIIDQKRIDALHRKEEKEKTEPLPKGLDPVTLNLIRHSLQNLKFPQSVQEIADHVQLSRITIRKYLDYLAENNEVILDLKYSNKGRPMKLYSYG